MMPDLAKEELQHYLDCVYNGHLLDTFTDINTMLGFQFASTVTHITLINKINLSLALHPPLQSSLPPSPRLPASLPTSLPAYLPACLPASRPAYLLACLL